MAGPCRSNTRMTRTRATPTGKCSGSPCSTSAIRPESCPSCSRAGRPFPSTTSRSMPSIPRWAGSPCVCRSLSAGRTRSPVSRSSAVKQVAGTCSTPHVRMRLSAPRAKDIEMDAVAQQLDLDAVFRESNIGAVLDKLERELIGLEPVKSRIRDIAALLLVDKLRHSLGLSAGAPSLHMSFTGNPGTGKTTVALRMAEILHRLGYVRKGHLIAVTRDDLVGQYIGHTAPKTREVLKRAMGGVLFIDEAYYLNRPDNERDYGQEAIEILLQVMESQREDLVVILAGYGDSMDKFFASNPGFRSRIAHHIDFPDYADDELLAIAELMLGDMNYKFSTDARAAFVRYIALRKNQPLFSNARSIRNALDRLRLRQANRLVADLDHVLTADDIRSIEASDVLASRVFGKGGKSAEA